MSKIATPKAVTSHRTPNLELPTRLDGLGNPFVSMR